MNNATPGPSDYFKSIPRGMGFSVDGGETQILGANHIYPWKGCMGHNINPVESDQSVLHSAAMFTIPKARRPCSEVPLGHGQKGFGPIKTDRGCLSPGIIYEHT